MADWLTPDAARALLELEPLPADPDDPERVAFTGALDAARGYVEEKRGDLVTGDPAEFDASPQIRLGTAMLAYRWFQRRTNPLGAGGYTEFGTDVVLRHDPDIAKMLGIGSAGTFRFGAAVPTVPEG